MNKSFELKIIQELKLYPSETLSIIDFLYILDYLLRQNEVNELQHVHKFIQDNYPHNSITWKDIDDESLFQMYQDMKVYIQKNSQKWKKQLSKQLSIQAQQIQEKKRIKKILKQKNITKEQLIDIYLEQIRRTKSLLVRNNSTKGSQQLKKQSTQLVTNVQKQKFTQNIELLQYRIDLIKKNPKLQFQSIQQSMKRSNKQKYSQREQQLKQISKNYFQFKKKYFQSHERNLYRQQLSELKDKVEKKKKYINKRIKQIFLHYSSENYDPTVSFQKNNDKLMRMDLRLFLKYMKELKQANRGHLSSNSRVINQNNNGNSNESNESKISTPDSSKNTDKDSLSVSNIVETNQKKFLSQNLTLIFKKHGLNQKQINYQQFLRMNYNLFFHDEGETNNANEMNEFDEDNNTEDKKMNQKYKKKTFSNSRLERQLSSQLQKNQKILCQKQLLKLQNLKNIFFNPNIDKLLNINSFKSKKTNDFYYKTSSTNSTSDDKSQNFKQRIGNLIDKSISDYQKTKNQIHNNILKKKSRTKIDKDHADQLEKRQEKGKFYQKADNSVSLSRNRSSRLNKAQKSLQNMRNKILQKQQLTIPIKITRNSKSSMSSYELPKNSLFPRSQTPLNKYIFQQIIQEVNNQQQQQQNVYIKTKTPKRSKSTGNILNIKPFSSDKKSPQIVTISQLSVRNKNKSFDGIKQIFSLPKITRMNQQNIQNQSIIKSLNYLYEKVGKKQQQKIKKILDINNPTAQKVHQQENKFLKQHFNNQIKDDKTIQKQKKLLCEKKCKKFKQGNYQKFMRFS